jgi:hypothetical protein
MVPPTHEGGLATLLCRLIRLRSIGSWLALGVIAFTVVPSVLVHAKVDLRIVHHYNTSFRRS